MPRFESCQADVRSFFLYLKCTFCCFLIRKRIKITRNFLFKPRVFRTCSTVTCCFCTAPGETITLSLHSWLFLEQCKMQKCKEQEIGKKWSWRKENKGRAIRRGEPVKREMGSGKMGGSVKKEDRAREKQG